MNSWTDKIRSTSSPQHKKERQTNTIKQPQNGQMRSKVGNTFPKMWRLCYPDLTEYILNVHNCETLPNNHNDITALERSVVNYRGLKLTVRDPDPFTPANQHNNEPSGYALFAFLYWALTKTPITTIDVSKFSQGWMGWYLFRIQLVHRVTCGGYHGIWVYELWAFVVLYVLGFCIFQLLSSFAGP